MSHRIITADEARALKGAARHGDWQVADEHGDPNEPFDVFDGEGVLVASGVWHDGNRALMLAAPDLAHTVVEQAAEIARLRKAIEGRAVPPTEDEGHAHIHAGASLRVDDAEGRARVAGAPTLSAELIPAELARRLAQIGSFSVTYDPLAEVPMRYAARIDRIDGVPVRYASRIIRLDGERADSRFFWHTFGPTAVSAMRSVIVDAQERQWEFGRVVRPFRTHFDAMLRVIDEFEAEERMKGGDV